MVLVKATFISRSQEDGGAPRYVFLLHPEDMQLLNIPAVRHYDPVFVPPADISGTDHMYGRPLGRAVTTRGAPFARQLMVHRGFAIRLPYNPESSGGRPDERPLPGLLPDLSNTWHSGQEFWVLLRGGWRTRATYPLAELKPAAIPEYSGLGIFPVIPHKEIGDYRGDLDQMPWHLHQNRGIPSMAEVLDADLAENPGMRRRKLDTWWRCWGIAVGMPVIPGILQLGQRLFVRGVDDPRFVDFYAAYARTGDDPSYVDSHDWLIRAHTEREYSPEDPLRGTVLDMANPEEYGSPGALLPLAMIDNPYAFVGPCSVRSISNANMGSGVRTRFPWWVCDLLARRIYGEQATHEPRASALVYETLQYLERRAHDAFRELGRDGFPKNRDADDVFDFDERGPSPEGSTVFERSIMERAVLRRVADLEGCVEANPRQPIRNVWIGGVQVTNPYPAIAGFLGVRMEAVPELHTPETRWEAAGRVVEPVQQPNHEGLLERRYGLRERVRASRQALEIMMQQSVPFGRNPVLPAAPALRRDDPRWETQQPPPARLLATEGQAHALETIYRWRMSMITGEAGTGKTALQRELARLAQQLSNEADTDRVIYVVLTPTNRAARSVLRVMQEQTSNIQLIGAAGEEIAQREVDIFTRSAEAAVIIGTVDSYLRKIEHDADFASMFLNNHVLIAFDEGGMLTHEAFVDVLQPFRVLREGMDEDDFFELAPNLLRVVVFGDPSQMKSIDPGDFLADCVAVLPVTRLTEQMRFGGADQELAHFFGIVRASMDSEPARRDVAEILLERAENPDPDSLLRVLLVDDLPAVAQLPHGQGDWFVRFRLGVEEQVRRILFRELLDWSRAELSAPSRAHALPVTAWQAAGADLMRATEDYDAFHRSVADPLMPFVITTMVRRLASNNPRLDSRTHYVSSSDRVNGWIHDTLRGWMVPFDPDWDPAPIPGAVPLIPAVGDERVRYLPLDARYVDEDPGRYEKFSTIWSELALDRSNRERTRRFLSDYRPYTLMLSPGWPYIVQTNDFKTEGVFRGERVRYMRAWRQRRKAYQVFEAEGGNEIPVPNRLCNRAYFNYGWATNVYQVQGAEFPLVVVLWLDGLNPGMMRHEWDRIRPRYDGRRMIPSLDPLPAEGGNRRYPALDDSLDLHALYTAVTRTQSRPEMVTRVDGREMRQTARGRCVLVVGKHALRRYLTLQVYPRVTALDGLLREALVGAQ